MDCCLDVEDECTEMHEYGRRSDERNIKTFPVTMRLGETPVPIPNTMVKPKAADGTMLETIWESRWSPEFMGV